MDLHWNSVKAVNIIKEVTRRYTAYHRVTGQGCTSSWRGQSCLPGGNRPYLNLGRYPDKNGHGCEQGMRLVQSESEK